MCFGAPQALKQALGEDVIDMAALRRLACAGLVSVEVCPLPTRPAPTGARHRPMGRGEETREQFWHAGTWTSQPAPARGLRTIHSLSIVWSLMWSTPVSTIQTLHPVRGAVQDPISPFPVWVQVTPGGRRDHHGTVMLCCRSTSPPNFSLIFSLIPIDVLLRRAAESPRQWLVVVNYLRLRYCHAREPARAPGIGRTVVIGSWQGPRCWHNLSGGVLPGGGYGGVGAHPADSPANDRCGAGRGPSCWACTRTGTCPPTPRYSPAWPALNRSGASFWGGGG